ncbi:EAL domain-containing protein [Pseudidiomarina marina]|uniref:putative bifunctional diguanylate cyclase/phosphodiesterase n=1 Tax=Pseudidiomarina marina TaxID=502366 RepID=UPI00384FE12D
MELFFDLGQANQPLVIGHHNWLLVLLSYAIALLGAYTSLLTLTRASSYKQPRFRHIWLIVSAVIAGLAVWSMHFIGMLAFEIPLEISHHVGLTFASVVPAVIANWFALKTQVSQHAPYTASIWTTLIAGLVLGFGIGAMHYVGMAAMRFDGILLYNVTWFSISIAVALALGVIAMLTYRVMNRWSRDTETKRLLSRVISAAIIALAISGMHYTAMFAARFYGVSEVNGQFQHAHWLAYFIGICAAIAILVAVFGTFVDKRLYAQAKSQKEARSIIHNLATRDSLTGLANRQMLIEHLEGIANATHALAIFDLNKFKALNNTFGASNGDLVLQQVADRLQNYLYNRVDKKCFVARLAGNEFAVVLPCSASSDQDRTKAETFALIKSIQALLEQPYKLGHFTHLLTVSVGVTRFDKTSLPDSILGEASLALAHAKLNHHRSGVEVFQASMAEQAKQQTKLENELRNALSKNELQLFLQPQVNHEDRIVGAEALLRWYHPEQGWISPAAFIPIAEDSGLIIEIGDWIIQQACEILKNWGHRAHTASLTLAINVSGRQFQQPDFVEKLCNALKHHGIKAQNLKLEITESLMLHDIEIVAEKMHELTRVGVQFAIDDFGTGYSSLLYLAELPFETLKIDVQFVRDMLHQNSTASIVQAIIQLAQSLNLSVIAEGVEEPEQRQFLSKLGCHTYQGYLFGRPVAVNDFNSLVNSVKTP